MYKKDIAKTYGEKAKAQFSAAQALMELISFKGNEDILDVGCGDGKITLVLSQKTSGNVVGVDISSDMIGQAKKKHQSSNLSFKVSSAENTDCHNHYDLLFSNSVLNWMYDQKLAAERMFAALKPNGLLALQATIDDYSWCPQISKAVNQVIQLSEKTQKIFEHYQSPYSFFDSIDDCKRLFVDVGFTLEYCERKKFSYQYSLEEAMSAFESAACQAYLSPSNFDIKLPDSFRQGVVDNVREYFIHQYQNQLISFEFNRMFLLARKKES